MADPKPWAEEDVREALRLHDTGLTWRQVGAVFGKSKSSAQAACRRFQGLKPKEQDYASCGPPIGLEQSEVSHRKDCKLGSQVLREACLDLFQRTANRYRISMDDAMACHLGYHAKPVIPGMERVVRGQFAQRRLAA